MWHVHSAGLIHRDIKPANLFVLTHARRGQLAGAGPEAATTASSGLAVWRGDEGQAQAHGVGPGVGADFGDKDLGDQVVQVKLADFGLAVPQVRVGHA